MTTGAFCTICQGHRLHERVFRRISKGHAIRVLVCTACDTKTPLGITCPNCGECRLMTWRTSHRGGATVRVKICKNPECKHRVRTREVLEAFTA